MYEVITISGLEAQRVWIGSNEQQARYAYVRARYHTQPGIEVTLCDDGDAIESSEMETDLPSLQVIVDRRVSRYRGRNFSEATWVFDEWARNGHAVRLLADSTLIAESTTETRSTTGATEEDADAADPNEEQSTEDAIFVDAIPLQGPYASVILEVWCDLDTGGVFGIETNALSDEGIAYSPFIAGRAIRLREWARLPEQEEPAKPQQQLRQLRRIRCRPPKENTMPYVWDSAEMYMRHNGVAIYHIYKDDDINQPVRDYHYGLTPNCSDSGDQCGEFDVRDLETYKTVEADNETERIAKAIIAAIESGELTALEEEDDGDDVLACASERGWTTFEYPFAMAVNPTERSEIWLLDGDLWTRAGHDSVKELRSLVD